VDSGLGGKQQEQADGVHPTEVVADDDVGTIGAVFATPDVKSEQHVEDGSRNKSRNLEHKGGVPTDRQHVRSRNRTALHVCGWLETDGVPASVEADLGRRRQPGAVEYPPAVVAAEISLMIRRARV